MDWTSAFVRKTIWNFEKIHREISGEAEKIGRISDAEYPPMARRELEAMSVQYKAPTHQITFTSALHVTVTMKTLPFLHSPRWRHELRST